MSTIRTGAAGRDKLASIVRSQLRSDWQNIDGENDDSIDGLIYLRYRNNFSGRLIFVQVKSGPSFVKDYKSPKYNSVIAIDIGKKYIEDHLPRWNALPGPVLLIFVAKPNSVSSPIYWQDLREQDSFSKTNKGVVLIPKQNRFGSQTKGTLRKLCGSIPDSKTIPEIDLRREKVTLIRPSFSRKEALRAYHEWMASPADAVHPIIGPIKITNLGWRHITRKGRRPDSILNSLLLLEAAKAITRTDTPWRQLGSAKVREGRKSTSIVDHIALRALVLFRYRAPGTVQVIIRRTRNIWLSSGKIDAKLTFLSVHELSRGNSQYYGR